MRTRADGDTEKSAYVQAGGKGGAAEGLHEGVGDPFTYRKRTGAFTVSEWLVGILLPIFVVLLGALLHHCFFGGPNCLSRQEQRQEQTLPSQRLLPKAEDGLWLEVHGL